MILKFSIIIISDIIWWLKWKNHILTWHNFLKTDVFDPKLSWLIFSIDDVSKKVQKSICVDYNSKYITNMYEGEE